MTRADEKLRILFVDDDKSLLAGLAARLRDRTKFADMAFASSGGEAIEAFEAAPFDLIVSDARMPGMNGAQLLAAVATRWPATMRVVLSGYADAELGAQFMPVAHQYLRKPCQPAQLDAVLHRCVALKRSLADAPLRALVGRVRQLPVLPGPYAKLRELLPRDNASLTDIARVIACDPAIAARVMQLSNSSFIRRMNHGSRNLPQAVAQLGLASLRNLVLSSDVFIPWNSTLSAVDLNLEDLQERALAVSTQAADEDGALIAVLREIGYWILVQECPEELERARKGSVSERKPLYMAVRRAIGASHCVIGAYLLGLWGLPDSVVNGVGLNA